MVCSLDFAGAFGTCGLETRGLCSWVPALSLPCFGCSLGAGVLGVGSCNFVARKAVEVALSHLYLVMDANCREELKRWPSMKQWPKPRRWLPGK